MLLNECLPRLSCDREQRFAVAPENRYQACRTDRVETMNKTALRRVLNRVLGMVARFAPGATSLRPFLHKLRGVRITGRVFIGDDVYLENEYPEFIELREGAQICVRSILITHTRGPGRIIVGKDAFLGRTVC